MTTKSPTLPPPLALCLEDLDADSASPERYMRCVALAGRLPGLVLTATGETGWQGSQPGLCEIWVSGDQRLMLYRLTLDQGPLVLQRDQRSLDVPLEKPVVLLDQDRLQVGSKHLRLHLHGEAPAVHPPEAFVPPAPQGNGRRRLMRAAATALALGASVGAAGCKSCVEVRDNPPAVEALPPDKGTQPAKPDAAAAKTAPIEVRDTPPEVAPRPEKKGGDQPPASKGRDQPPASKSGDRPPEK